ncbi:MAG: exo-alpha-sialidase [Verrucomicrobia bacterium]|nr:exo-alpha-sialidase [Verrucomicrobiota bacterium]
MERLIRLLAALACAASAHAQPTLVGDAPVAVFEAKKNLPHASVRIPALLRTKKGTLIAAAEARDKATDQAGNDLVVATSKDDGVTWSKPRVAYDQGKDSCNNPTLVEDELVGRVYLFFQTFPAGSHEFGGLPVGDAPEGTRIRVIASDDEGETWSRPADLTKDLKPAGAVTTASGPGVGIKLKAPAHAGRLVIPFNSQDKKRNFVNWVAYSDDGGRSWHRGGDVPQDGGRQLNEVQVAEARDGTLYLNSRRWKGAAFRKVAWSKDGGQTWSPATDESAHPDPTCQGSLLRIDEGASTRFYFLNPAGKGRSNGTLRRSDDGGKTWSQSTLLFPGPFAYSSMAPVKGGLGVLYEPAGNSTVLYRRVALEPTAGR